MAALETIRNIGPAFGASLRAAGILDAETLRVKGALHWLAIHASALCNGRQQQSYQAARNRIILW